MVMCPHYTSLSGLKVLCCALLLCVSILPAWAQPQRIPLTTALQRIVDTPEFANAWWGVHVTDLETGEVIFSENASRSMIPASNTKLFTTAAALDQLGPEHRYETRLYADGKIHDGTLDGNLIIQGAGDPTVGGEAFGEPRTGVFMAWADSLRKAGIMHITGDLVGDDDIFDDVPLGNSWAWDDEVYGYSAQQSGLSFHDNVIDVQIKSRSPGQPGVVSWEPIATSYVTVHNATRTIAPNRRLQEGYHRDPGTNRITLFSEVPQGYADTESIAVHNPTLFFVHVLREVLIRQGISIDGRAVDIDDLSIRPRYEAYRRVASHRSPPVTDLVRIINKESQNLYSEQLLRTLGTTYPEDSDKLIPGSTEMGLAAAMHTYAKADVDTSRLQLVDGSGLSRKNLVTPVMVVQLLQYMARHPNARVRNAFDRSLAVGGKDGTLEYRFRGGNADVRGKTGSLGNVSALSGYIHTSSGRHLAFAILCNHYTARARSVHRAQDRIVHLLSERM